MLSAQQVVDQAEGLAALALVITNSDAYEAKREELKQYAQDGMDAFSKAQDTLSEANKIKKDSLSQTKEAQQIVEDYNKLHDQLSSKVDEAKAAVLLREQNADAREQKIKAQEDASAQRMQESLVREQETNRLRKEAEDLVSKASKDSDAASNLRSLYESKLAQLREAVNVVK